MKQIITHFTDNDLYSFTVMYYILQKYGKPTAKGMVESGIRHIEILENLDFHNIALSLKASDLNLCIES